MKHLLIFLSFFWVVTTVNAQNLSNCQVVEWTLDDLTFTPQYNFEFGSLINANCGCSQNGYNASNCVLVKLTLVKTVGSQQYEQDCSKLLNSGDWFTGRPGTFNTPHNYVDIYNASTCAKYFPQGTNSQHEDIFQIPLNVSPGETVELLVCKDTNESPMKGYFNEMNWCTNTGVAYNPHNNTLDSDNDGVADNLDCQPNNPNIYPGATEIPNNDIDEDCTELDLVTSIPSTHSRPIITAEVKPIIFSLGYKEKVLCYKNGAVGLPNITCSQCEGTCVSLQLIKTSHLADMEEIIKINIASLNGFINNSKKPSINKAFILPDETVIRGKRRIGSLSDEKHNSMKAKQVRIKIGA